MYTVAGLGNPGPEYADTRHNAGFRLADEVASRWELPAYRRASRMRVTHGAVAGSSVRILKPLTYMNRSGMSIEALLAEATFDPSTQLLVLVDDEALPLGRFRLRASGSSGGHHGLRSIENSLQSQAFARLRIGVGPRPEGADLAEFVLAPFAPDESRTLSQLLPTMAEAVGCWVTEGIEVAMNRFNVREAL